MSRRWRRCRRRPHVIFLNNLPSWAFLSIIQDLYDLNTVEPLRLTGWATVETFYTTKYQECADRPWGPALRQYLRQVQPDAIISARMGWEDPAELGQFVTATRSDRQRGVPVIAMWTDLVTTDQIALAERMLDYVDWHTQIDRPVVPNGVRDPDRYLPLWTPMDWRFFYRTTPKPIPISFVGEKIDRPERQRMLNAVERSGLPLYVSGGRGSVEAQLSTSRYAEIQRASQIGINVTSHPTAPQIKGRIFELLACGSLLLEWDNAAIHTYFEPEEDYVAYHTPDELVDKLWYYMSHLAERERIARHGHETFMRRFTLWHYWDKVFTKLWGKAWR